MSDYRCLKIGKIGMFRGMLFVATVVPQSAIQPTPLPSLSPLPLSSPAEVQPLASPFPVPSPTYFKSNVLLREFLAAQRSEIKATEHRNRLNLKELKASQDARMKEFQTKERENRIKYFEEHTKGPERREYIRDFIERRENLRQQFSKERLERIQEQEKQMDALRKTQVERLDEFKSYLEKGIKPPALLWPSD